MTEQIQEVSQPTQSVQSLPVEPKKESKLPLIVVLLIVIWLIALGAIYAVKYFSKPKACTLEAKICPDGSSVGRTGPNCEFAPCPEVSVTPEVDETANWKTYKNEAVEFQFKYPSVYLSPKLPTGPGEKDELANGTEKTAVLVFSTSEGDGPKEYFYLEFAPFIGTAEDLQRAKDIPSISKYLLVKRTKIGDQIADWYMKEPQIIYPDNVETGNLEIFFVQNNYGFHLFTERNHSEKEIDQILSTFKFLD